MLVSSIFSSSSARLLEKIDTIDTIEKKSIIINLDTNYKVMRTSVLNINTNLILVSNI